MNDETTLGISTHAEKVVTFMRDRILSGVYKPGQRINEAQLAATLGISRSPIREAIRQLAKEGLLQVASYKGARVTIYTRATIVHLFELREALEGMAARLAASRATPNQLEDMASLLASVQQKLERDEGGGYPYDRDFHELLGAMSENEQLRERAIDVNAQIQVARSISGASAKRAIEALTEHRGVFAAIRDGDAEMAEQLMRAHVRGALKHVLEVLNPEDMES